MSRNLRKGEDLLILGIFLLFLLGLGVVLWKGWAPFQRPPFRTPLDAALAFKRGNPEWRWWSVHCPFEFPEETHQAKCLLLAPQDGQVKGVVLLCTAKRCARE